MDEEEAVHAQPVASTSKLPSAAEAPGTAGPSKSSLKKAARQARFEATKQHRRQAEEERKKARDAQRRQDLKDGKLSVEEIEAMQAKRKAKEIKKRGGKSHVTDEDCWQGGVIMDLGFDDLMLESVSLQTDNDA
jgi:tRNA (guanine9-N1)-methyltransferase